MSKEYIWGCELNANKKVFVYDVNDDDDLDENLTYSLLLKQATLGSNVPDGQVNVVTIESLGLLANPISQPLFRLTAGKTEQCQLDILISHTGTKLTLAEGSGPVYLLGQQLVELEEEGSEEEEEGSSVGVEALNEVEDDSEEEDEEDLKDELEFLNGDIAKHSMGEPAPGAADKQKKRMASVEPERERKVQKRGPAEEDEELEEDDEEEEEATPEKKKKGRPATAKKAKGKAAGKK